MQTEVKDKHHFSYFSFSYFSEEPPLPPAPHFDSASIAEAKPVQPLLRSRNLRYSRTVLRLGTAVLAGLTVMVLAIGTMARLNSEVHNQTKFAPAPETSQAADATPADSPNIEAESTPMAPGNVAPLVGAERRRHGGPHHFRAPRDMFEIEQEPVYGRPRARLVTVIQ